MIEYNNQELQNNPQTLNKLTDHQLQLNLKNKK